MSETTQIEVTEAESGARVDVFIASHLDDISRSVIQRAVRADRVSVNGQPVKRVSQILNSGDEVAIDLPDPPTIAVEAEAIPLEIIYQDDDLVIVNKPSGLVVHPAPGHASGTLLNAILHHCPDFTRPGGDPLRPGIIHRLDRDTSGVLVIAKTPQAMTHLAAQAREHTFDRRYLALVRGEFPEDKGRINAAVGRSLSDRKRMTVTMVGSREAVTYFRVLDRFGVASQVALKLETGRTHQIRVHMRFAGHPVLGDTVYGVTDFRAWDIDEVTRQALEGLGGQALHAETLGITHPRTGKRMTFSAPPPNEYLHALEALSGMKSNAP